jgi:adenylate cyclase
MAAQSIERTGDLEHEVAALRKQQRALSTVLRAIARSEGLQVVLDEIVEACRQLCEGDHGALWLLRDGLLHSVSHDAGGDASRYDREHPHAVDRTTIAGRVAATRALVHVPDILEDADYAYPGPRPFRAMLGAPVMMEDELLRTFADQAAIALANARLLEAVDRQRGELARFLPQQVAELVASEEGERLLAGHRAFITCVFCDLRGFTAFAETAAPEELLDVLRGYHETVGRLVTEHEGTLEHFAGDGLMVFFNDPVPLADHELRATRFALAAQAQFDELARIWRKRGTNLDLGIGVEAGHATVGRIGFEGRYDYGAVGPAVNLASRLSSHAAGGQILVGQRVFAAIDEEIPTASIGALELKGFARPMPAYEIHSGAQRS